MDWFKEIWNQVSSVLKWWVIILPWEKGLRIRFGKNVKILGPGIHFRIPYFDSCYRQPIRLDFLNLSPQTLTTLTGETITLSVIVGYSISNIQDVYNSVSELQGAITGTVSGAIADFISRSGLNDCKPFAIEIAVKDGLDNKGWGIHVEAIKVTSYAVVRTYRLIQDGAWMQRDHRLDTKI